MAIELDSTLAQAEVLFLSFSQTIADVDRREAEVTSSRTATLRQRHSGTSNGTSADTTTHAKRTIISEDLRELLKAGQ